MNNLAIKNPETTTSGAIIRTETGSQK